MTYTEIGTNIAAARRRLLRSVRFISERVLGAYICLFVCVCGGGVSVCVCVCVCMCVFAGVYVFAVCEESCPSFVLFYLFMFFISRNGPFITSQTDCSSTRFQQIPFFLIAGVVQGCSFAQINIFEG